MNYPYDIFTLVRKKTFSVEGHFIQRKDDSPMKIFDDNFTRYVFNIISDGSVAYMNMRMNMLPAIRAKTDIAANLNYTPAVNAAGNVAGGNTKHSPGFTRKFGMGELKGKTPVDVLLEYGEEGKLKLQKQFVWLKENLPKYPKNQEMMDAIIDASKQDLSTLSAQFANPASTVELFKIGCRPLPKKTREDGKTFVYEGAAVWDTSRDYAVSLTIRNYYAPVIKKEDGTLNVNVAGKDRDTEIVKVFNMTGEEWLAALYNIEACRDNFRTYYFGKAYQAAEKAGEDNRSAARATSINSAPAA